MAVLFCLAVYLVTTGCGDWAARVGSVLVAVSLVRYLSVHGPICTTPSDGPIVIDGGSAAEYVPSEPELTKFSKP